MWKYKILDNVKVCMLINVHTCIYISLTEFPVSLWSVSGRLSSCEITYKNSLLLRARYLVLGTQYLS